MSSYDFVLVGGGLQNVLIALAIFSRSPGAKVALIERASSLGGSHTWSFHSGDLPGSCESIVQPLVVHRWAGYEVRFPGSSRRLMGGYHSMTSARVDAVGRAAFDARPERTLLLGRTATRVSAHEVELDDGHRLQARMVVDARGPSEDFVAGGRYQKFLGLELRVRTPSPFELPLLMDATVPQRDGFRFVYVLPLAADRVLIEDTYYSDSHVVAREDLRGEILAYAARSGLHVEEVVREERGVLPLPLYPLPVAPPSSPLAAGFAAGWLHPTTGYSFPLVVRLADAISRGASFEDEYRALAGQRRRQTKLACFLNRLLFLAPDPGDRWRMLERFYRRLPDDTIGRFYGLTMNRTDYLRLFAGAPPRGLPLRALLRRDVWAQTAPRPEVDRDG